MGIPHHQKWSRVIVKVNSHEEHHVHEYYHLIVNNSEQYASIIEQMDDQPIPLPSIIITPATTTMQPIKVNET